MANKARYIKLFESLHIHNPHKVYDAFMNDYFTQTIMFRKNMRIYQTGGRKGTFNPRGADKYVSSDSKVIRYDFDGRTFIIYESEEPGGRYELSMHPNDNQNSPEYCLYIKTTPNYADDTDHEAVKLSGTAILQSISYYKKCVSTGLNIPAAVCY